MASARWSNLPPEILPILSKLLDSDVDTLRLRAVCTSWRSSLRPRPRPSPFPLKLPAIVNMPGGHFRLNYSTLYRLSPPEIGPYAGDPSDGWLFRASEVNPNRFKILPPLLPRSVELPAGTVPKCLNLLDHRIAEVSRSYNLSFHDDYGDTGFGGCLDFNARKVTVLWNYADDCEFAVVALFSDKVVSYWKFGDKAWTRIDSTGYEITDVTVWNGRCYAISRDGVVVEFDSKLRLKVVPIQGSLPVGEKYLVDYKSELYAISKIFEYTRMDETDAVIKIFDYAIRDESNEEAPNGVSVQLEIFKKSNDKWKPIKDLGNEMLISTDDVSVGLSAEYFKGGRGNCVHVAQSDFVIFPFFHGGGKGLHYGVVYLDGDGSASFKLDPSDDGLHWPPPEWLKKIAQGS